MMEKAIRDFPKQFEFEPVVENAGNLKKRDKFIVCGMGGSNLTAGLLKIRDPFLEIIAHRNYGLPAVSDEFLQDSLVIASSYSGNTEETMDAFNLALERRLAAAAISIGGKLLELAKERGAPFVEMPDTAIQPRLALGFNLRAQLKLTGNENALVETKKLAELLDVDEAEKRGKDLAEKISGKVPIIYSSEKNQPIAYNWKIKFNETGKIPAFYNVFPELNHNEMTGFSAKGGSASGGDVNSAKPLSQKFYFIFLPDAQDSPRILKRMDLTKKLYEDRGLGAEVLELAGENIWHKIFSSLLIADWAAYYTAIHYGAEPEQVPMVEEFKKLMA